MSRQLSPLSHQVYVKKMRTPGVAFDGVPVGAPTDGGFVFDPNLRCIKFSCEIGADVGRTELAYVPQDGTLPSFEKVLAQYTTDDQYRVVVQPIDDPILGQDLPDGVEDMTVAEGVFELAPFRVGSTGTRDDEQIRFIGVPLPTMDNVAPEHQITGRWVAADPNAGTATPAIIESMGLLAVFNLGGQPNMSAKTFDANYGGGTLSANLFTHDQDPDGEYWTVRKAIASILAMWGFGPASSAALPRGFDLDADTAKVLNQGAAFGEAWVGINAYLPEVNVHGLGVLEAIEAVCEAVGYEMSVMPHYGIETGCDRLYVLSVNRVGGGPEATMMLEPRGGFASDDPDEILRNNTISTFRAARDASRVRNQVYSIGPSVVEGAFQLKPFWLPSEVTRDVTASAYKDRHVTGGTAFGDYRHVGRVWGIDCTGSWAKQAGYDEALYKHPDGGFDWVSELGLAGGGSAIVADRLANNIETPIVWTRQVRNLAPLRSPAAQANGTRYIVEVTEDGGSSWSRVPIEVRTLERQCGVAIQFDDLSKINLAMIEGGVSPAPEESWWGLMFPEDGEPQFALRVTASVAADHGAVALAPRQSSAGSVYLRQKLVRNPIEEVWTVPGSLLNTGTSFVRTAGWGVSEYGEQIPPLDLAERERDASETLRITGEATVWQMDFPLWRLGHRVSKISGRDFTFDVSASGGRHPSVAGIVVTLSGFGKNAELNQLVQVALSDNSQIGGQD